MKLYICDTPFEFPRSEYGGMLVVMANSKKELGKMITEYYKPRPGGYFNLSLSAKTCKELELDPAKDYQPGIVSEFLT